MKLRELWDRIVVRSERALDYYEHRPRIQKLAIFSTAAACVFAAVSLYAISKEPAPPPPRSSVPVARPERKTAASFPSDRLDLKNWKLTLPVNTGHAGEPDEIEQPELTDFAYEPYFMNNPDGDGVRFRAPAGGATTEHSDYPRSELREMIDGGREEASWSNEDGDGTHTMTVRQAITHLPGKKSELVAAQIHDDSDDIVMVRLEEHRLFVEADGDNIGDLEMQYELGTPYTVKIVAADEKIKIFYNGRLKVTYDKSGDDYYFKAGCYTQTNTDRGDKADSYGEVVIYDIDVSHE